MKYFFRLVAIILLLMQAACSNKLLIADENFIRSNMPFIADGTSRREEIILKLGEPNWVFEDGRILTYRVLIDKKGNLTPVSNDNNKSTKDMATTRMLPYRTYSLVLVFDKRSVLEKHSLILTNP